MCSTVTGMQLSIHISDSFFPMFSYCLKTAKIIIQIWHQIPTWETTPNILESHSGCPPHSCMNVLGSWGQTRTGWAQSWYDRHLLHLGTMTWGASSENGNQAMPHPAWGGNQSLTAGWEEPCDTPAVPTSLCTQTSSSPKQSTLGEMGPRHLSLLLGPRDFPLSNTSSFLGAQKSPTVKLIHLNTHLFIKGPLLRASALLGMGAGATILQHTQRVRPHLLTTFSLYHQLTQALLFPSPLVKNLHLKRLSTF